MKIEQVDFFYLAMPEITDRNDSSQDACIVRVQAGEHVGWGQCEASPLTSIAAGVCPKSHGACWPVRDSVLGQRIDGVEDIVRINRDVRKNSLDLLQADHTLSGCDIALWDLLGKKTGLPVYRLLGYERAFPKLPYASQLFGDEPQETYRKASQVRAAGYRATKFGWGPYGKGSAKLDADHVEAARDGLGDDGVLLVDAGTVWGDDVAAAAARLESLEKCRALWLEEPFTPEAFEAYAALAKQCRRVKLAGGEGCHEVQRAKQMIDQARVGYIQIDAGRIGGITAAKEVADHAAASEVTFVNHTFTTQLLLCASIQPYAGLESHELCEYPVEPTPLGRDLTREKLLPDADGRIYLPEKPGLGLEPNEDVMRKYLLDVEIKVGGQTLYSTPSV